MATVQTGRVFRDRHLQRQFDEDGFIVTRLVSAADAEALLDELLAHRASAPVSVDPGIDQSFFNQDVAYRRRVDALGAAAIESALDVLLTDYRVNGVGLMTKRAGGPPLNLHRDDAILRDPDQVVVNTWCALAPVDADNGAMALLRGSHRLPNLEVRGTPRFYQDYAATLKDWTEVVALDAGEAILFDHRLLHWSVPNRTQEARHALRAISVPRRERLVFFKVDPQDDRRFEVVASEGDTAVDHSFEQLMRGEVACPSLGHVRNDNRPVSLTECAQILGRTDPYPSPRPSPFRAVARRLRRWAS